MKHKGNPGPPCPSPASTTDQGRVGVKGDPSTRRVVMVCPTVEELRPQSASPCHRLMCPVAGCRSYTFKSQRYLMQHINALHPQLNPCRKASDKEESEEYHFHCPQADCVYNSLLQQRWFSSLDLLRYHYVNTHDEKQFACGKCGKSFGWKRDQEHHERECGQIFTCGTCSTQYSSRRTLLTHCARKQHPLPAQYEKPVKKARDPGAESSSARPVGSSVGSKASNPSTVTVSASAREPGVASAVSATSSATPGASAFLSTCTGAVGVPPVVSSATSDVPGGLSAVLSTSSGVPGVASAVTSLASSGAPGVPSAVTSLASSGIPGVASAVTSLAISGIPGVPSVVTPLASSGVPGVPSVVTLLASSGVPGVPSAVTSLAISGIPGVPSAVRLLTSLGETGDASAAAFSASSESVSAATSTSSLPVLSDSGTAGVPFAVTASDGSGVPYVTCTSLVSMGTSGVSSSITVPTSSGAPGVPSIASLHTPEGSCALTSSASSGESSVPPAVAVSTSSATLGESSAATSQCSGIPSVAGAATSAAAADVPCDILGGIQTSATACMPDRTSEVSPSVRSTTPVSLPSFSVAPVASRTTSGVSPSTPLMALSAVGTSGVSPSTPLMALSAVGTSGVAPSTPLMSLSAVGTSGVAPVPLSPCGPSKPGVRHAAGEATSFVPVVSPSLSAGLSVVENSGPGSTPADSRRARGSVPDISSAWTRTAQVKSSADIVTAQVQASEPDRGTVRDTAPARSMTHGTETRKKLRPILPKSQGVVLLGAGPAALYAVQECVAGTARMVPGASLPWVDGTSPETAAVKEAGGRRGGGVSTACQTNVGVEDRSGGKDRVQVSVVHIATQVSRDALHPLTCHTGTQVQGPSQLRGDSTHTAVQTCVRTAHSATQLAAPLPSLEVSSQGGRTLIHVSRPLEEERPQVCAVAIQAGGHVDTVNMAIQATAQHPTLAPLSAQGRGVVVDVIGLCDGQPEDDHYMAMVGSSVSSSPSGTHTASQTSFPYILLNKANTTNTTGTQVVTDYIMEESDVASRGMQTSVTLIHRPMLSVMTAQTQTCGDASQVPVLSRSPRSHSRTSGGRVRKRSTKCTEVQTQACSPRRKKGRRKGTDAARSAQGDCMQEISIATQTPAQESLHQTHTITNTASGQQGAGWPSRTTKQHRNSKSSRCSDGRSSKNRGPQRNTAAGSPQSLQNPGQSALAAHEDQPGVWDPFLSSPMPAPSSSPTCDLAPHLEDLFSQYRVELGVQTPQDFLSAFTADFGVQTVDEVLSTTADLAVQTLDERPERCTAEFGVQTVTTALGYLMENLDTDFPCSILEEDMMDPATTSLSLQSLPESDCAGQGLTLESRSQTQAGKPFFTTPQTQSMGSQAEEFDFHLDTGTAPKLFDSFDSDLSFSDCGTGTEDFFASTHTQTPGLEMMVEEDCLPPALPSQAGLQGALPQTYTPQARGKERSACGSGPSQMDLLETGVAPCDSPPNEVSDLVGEGDMPMDMDSACLQSRPTSTSTTDTDLLSGVPATDMHTQTADDLLTFLMNNMETQTTEELCDNKMAVTDTHTQTTSSVLLTPPHPLTFDRSSPPWFGEEEGVASAETQTSGHFMWDLHQDQEELFDLANIET